MDRFHPLRRLGWAIEAVDEGWNVANNGTSALADWVANINRSRVLHFAEDRFSKEFRQLDGGDKRILVSFLDPEPISNTASLLGCDLRAALGSLLAFLEAPPGLLRKVIVDPDSELALDSRAVFAFARDAFGKMAEHDTPVVMEHEDARAGNERWFFIDGIFTTRELARREADKLKALLGHGFITVHNPTHGLIADLVESALQKFANVNTEPVAAAIVQIATALVDRNVAKVALVAHSQGTIIAGDVLDLIYYALDPTTKEHLDKTNMSSEDVDAFLKVSHGTVTSDEVKRALAPLEGQDELVKAKLELYMLANAASRMCYLDPAARKPHLESFANEHDLVTRLGCLAEDAFHEEGLIRIDGPVFMRSGTYGHLLNAHYLSGDAKNAYALLPENPTNGSVRRSLHDRVTANPCSKNSKRAPGDPNATSKLLTRFRTGVGAT